MTKSAIDAEEEMHGPFREWATRRMRVVGLNTDDELAKEVGVTVKTMRDYLNQRKERPTKSMHLAVARCLLVGVESVLSAYRGELVDIPNSTRTRWPHYDKHITNDVVDADISESVRMKFNEIASHGRPGKALECAMEIFFAAWDSMSRHGISPGVKYGVGKKSTVGKA